MGEILRAVMTENCISSRPRWYGGDVEITAPVPGSAQASAITQFDQGGYFLLTGFSVNTDDSTVPTAVTFQIQNMTSGFVYFQNLNGDHTSIMCAGGSMVAPMQLDEYILFEPGERIGFFAFATTVAGQPAQYNVTVTYAGIEFLMPSGSTPLVENPV